MKILFITDNFPPETNAPASRTYEHCKHWVNLGHSVDVITCYPNFPEGKIHEGFKNNWWRKYQLSGINILRVPTYITENDGFIKRVLDYFSFLVSAIIGNIFFSRSKYDFVIATSPQFFTGIAGCIISMIDGSKFVLEIRDLWPESVAELGLISRKNAFYKCFEFIEKKLYKRADKIIVAVNGFKKIIQEKGGDANKICCIYNGVDLAKFTHHNSESRIKILDGDESLRIGYIGTLGLAHGLDYILDAAKKLSTDKITFIFVGSGAAKSKLLSKQKKESITNVQFFPRCAKDDVVKFWESIDIALISLLNIPLFENAIPSKVFEALAMEKPLLVSTPKGELTNLLNDLNLNFYYNSPGEIDSLVKLLKNLSLNKNNLVKINRRSVFKFDRKRQAENMLNFLQK